MEFVEVLKMSLAQMPGGNRIDTETGLPRAKNFCQLSLTGQNKKAYFKFEPIFVWKKK